MDGERNRRRKKELVNQSEKQGVGVGDEKHEFVSPRSPLR